MSLIYQSYRTENVPPWISRCMKSVQSWAAARNYTYRFIDDVLFSYAPAWYRKKVKDNVQLVSDLARLLLAKKFLAQGYERVIWVDADMLIFDPENFELPEGQEVYFCKETWVDADLEGKVIHLNKINNSTSVFYPQNVFLDFYIDACLRMVKKSKDTPHHVWVGTAFLTHLNQMLPLSLIHNVGIISPALVHDLLKGQRKFLDKHLEWQGSPVYAANLCGSMQNKIFKGVEINNKSVEAVVKNLLLQKSLICSKVKSRSLF